MDQVRKDDDPDRSVDSVQRIQDRILRERDVKGRRIEKQDEAQSHNSPRYGQRRDGQKICDLPADPESVLRLFDDIRSDKCDRRSQKR